MNWWHWWDCLKIAWNITLVKDIFDNFHFIENYLISSDPQLLPFFCTICIGMHNYPRHVRWPCMLDLGQNFDIILKWYSVLLQFTIIFPENFFIWDMNTGLSLPQKLCWAYQISHSTCTTKISWIHHQLTKHLHLLSEHKKIAASRCLQES